MTLIRNKGYVATITKEIARVAGINEGINGYKWV